MRVVARALVFDKIQWVLYFTYVVIQCSSPHQQRIASDTENGVFGQVSHLQRVLEGTGCRESQFAQKGGVGIGELDEREIASRNSLMSMASPSLSGFCVAGFRMILQQLP